MKIDSMCTFIAGALLLVASGAQVAQAAGARIGSGATGGIYQAGVLIDESSLARMRGGFNISGMEVYFGATLETIFDSVTKLTTVYNLTRTGPQLVSQTVSSALEESVTQVGPGAVPISDIAPPDIDLSGLAQWSGIVLDDTQGFTAALHNITDDAIISSVISDASGRDIQQRVDISVNIANMPALRAAAMRSSIVNSLLR